tara:strand:- start:4930 stop:5367 length:438 start_codon:yes stop_codon:yes gene_type:complete
MSVLFGALNSYTVSPYPTENVLTRSNKSQIGTVRSSKPSYSTILTLDLRSDVSNGAGANILDIKTHGQGGRFLWKNFKDLSTSYKTKKTDIFFSRYIHYISMSSTSSLPISGSESTGPLDEQTVTFKTVPSKRNKRDVSSYNPYG